MSLISGYESTKQISYNANNRFIAAFLPNFRYNRQAKVKYGHTTRQGF